MLTDGIVKFPSNAGKHCLGMVLIGIGCMRSGGGSIGGGGGANGEEQSNEGQGCK